MFCCLAQSTLKRKELFRFIEESFSEGGQAILTGLPPLKVYQFPILDQYAG